MSGLDPVAAVGAEAGVALAQASPPSPSVGDGGFGALLGTALEHLEGKIDSANALVRAYALDNSLPVHQVTVALEEARLAVELAMQVRSRLVEGYRELMNMQL